MILRQDLIAVLAEELEADCNPVVALDTVLDYLHEHAEEWDEASGESYMTDQQLRAPTDGAAKCLGLVAALRIQENQ